MTAPVHRPWLHRFAIATVCVALVTMTMGALVTSRNAGMAFRDWPTSDGQAMLTYPWFQDFASNWDKFLEHGHRLAGVLIGLFSIALCGLLIARESRTWLKAAGVAILVCVIIQGVLGGFRVWLDERGLAMVHGAFAACVFALMASTAQALSRTWVTSRDRFRTARAAHLRPMAVITVATLMLQYLLGGLIRHGGTGLHEHLGLGLLAVVIVLANAIIVTRAHVGWLTRSAWCLFALVIFQASLGGMTWVTRYGFPPTGYVAVADSIQQTVFRTVHTVLGIIVLMTSVLHAVRVFRVVHVADPLPESPVVTAESLMAASKGGLR
ncbi:Heme A synthase [Maioricimonas rarisocia]|uniref:Heme A synthase n=1 Tax=Maioricimonas rarisocia TaxID=2528026 RepID=A0A517Z1V9_9PLAN|nr:COX15/CtaA family protein [Maioricimonas rarisocia]QDU36445.1 Heme A synthase [Maioricimonas rarisocia]